MPVAELAQPSRRLSDRRTHGPIQFHAPSDACWRRRDEVRFGQAADACGSQIVFPALRPCGGRTAAGRRAGTWFDPRASATTWILWQGLEVLARPEREHIVHAWGTGNFDQVPSLIADGGCDVRLRGSAHADAVRAALLEWLPLSQADLAVYEGGLFHDTPARSLTLLVRPPTIWSIDEAVIAARRFRRGSRFDPKQFAALVRHAHGRLCDTHLDRLREVSARIEKQLPADGLPEASTVVVAGCSVLAGSDEVCASIAAVQLARYALSARAARSARSG